MGNNLPVRTESRGQGKIQVDIIPALDPRGTVYLPGEIVIQGLAPGRCPMLVACPHCGGMVTVNGLGRKALNMPVTKVCDAIQLQHSVSEAAKELGCSRAYIYKVLKAAGLTPADAIKGLKQTSELKWREAQPITESIWQSMTPEQRRQAARGKGIVPTDKDWEKLSKDQKRFLGMRTTTIEKHATKDTRLLHKGADSGGR